MRPSLPTLRPLFASCLLAPVALACGGGDTAESAGGGVRDTLPDGTPIVRYTDLDARDEIVALQPDLRIGSLEGTGPDVFGDVRGIEAAPDGEVYVLDTQAAQVRVFGPRGEHRRTLSRRGEGPGELGDVNGMVLAGDTLFVYDHAKWTLMGLHRIEGGEVARYPTPVRSYGYLWSGTRDDRGRFWKATSHSDAPRTFPPEEGLNEGTARTYLKVYDPATEAYDSVFFGEQPYQSWVASMGNGYTMASIPFRGASVTVVDPAGGFWQPDPERYRLVRLDGSGDTTLVVEAAVEPLTVTEADREAFVEPWRARGPEGERLAREVLDHAPSTHPAVKSVFVSSDGRLWVERTTPADAPPLYDVFTRDGSYRGSLRLGFQPSPYFRPVIRGGHLYTLAEDDLDVPYVVRAPLPDWAVEGG